MKTGLNMLLFLFVPGLLMAQLSSENLLTEVNCALQNSPQQEITASCVLYSDKSLKKEIESMKIISKIDHDAFYQKYDFVECYSDKKFRILISHESKNIIIQKNHFMKLTFNELLSAVVSPDFSQQSLVTKKSDLYFLTLNKVNDAQIGKIELQIKDKSFIVQKMTIFYKDMQSYASKDIAFSNLLNPIMKIDYTYSYPRISNKKLISLDQFLIKKGKNYIPVGRYKGYEVINQLN